MFGTLHFQRKNCSSLNASSLELMLPDAPNNSLGDLQLQQPQHFIIHLDHVQPHEPIEEFRGVIGQNGELIHKNDYVELSSCYYQVSTIMHLTPRIQYQMFLTVMSCFHLLILFLNYRWSMDNWWHVLGQLMEGCHASFGVLKRWRHFLEHRYWMNLTVLYFHWVTPYSL